jgi:serine/threonine protein kinase
MKQYIRQEEIGRGAWSVVYKAFDDITGEVVAIKELIDEAGVPKREVTIGRKVTHRNVCRIHYSFVNENGSQCIVM